MNESGQGALADGDTARPSSLDPDRVWRMLESAPDGMLMADGDGVILAVNRQVERLFGYDRSELLGHHVEVLLPVHLHDVHRTHRERYRAAPTARALGEGAALRARRNDGTEFPVEVSLSPLRDDGGLAVVASIRDVTDRRRASAQLRRIREAIDSVFDGVFMFDPTTLRFVYANEGASKQTGYSNDELLAMTPLEIKPEFTRSRFESLIRPLIDGSTEHVSLRTVHRRKSGRDVPVDIVLEYRQGSEEMHDLDPADDGRPLLVAVVRDVTQQVEVERRLAVSEAVFRTSFENAPVGMTLTRTHGDGRRRFEQVNDAFANMVGRSVDSLIGADFVDVMHPDDREHSNVGFVEMDAGRRDSLVFERRIRRPDGRSVWVLVHASAIDRTDGLLTLTHVVDITDRRERQAERERVSTMEDRERIARDIHDLVIQRLFGAGMKLHGVIPEMRSATAIDRANETVDELDAAIRELRSAIFSLHRREAVRTVSDDVELAIEQCVDQLGFRPQLRIDGSLDSLDDRRSVELLATIREALSNVARHADASTVDMSIEVSDAALELRVRDDGVGIESGRPLGNGLSNLRSRAEVFGGEFHVAPCASGGTELVWVIGR